MQNITFDINPIKGIGMGNLIGIPEPFGNAHDLSKPLLFTSYYFCKFSIVLLSANVTVTSFSLYSLPEAYAIFTLTFSPGL